MPTRNKITRDVERKIKAKERRIYVIIRVYSPEEDTDKVISKLREMRYAPHILNNLIYCVMSFEKIVQLSALHEIKRISRNNKITSPY